MTLDLREILTLFLNWISRKLMIRFVGVFWIKFWTGKGLGRDGGIGFQDACLLLLLQLLLMVNLDPGSKVKEV